MDNTSDFVLAIVGIVVTIVLSVALYRAQKRDQDKRELRQQQLQGERELKVFLLDAQDAAADMKASCFRYYHSFFGVGTLEPPEIVKRTEIRKSYDALWALYNRGRAVPPDDTYRYWAELVELASSVNYTNPREMPPEDIKAITYKYMDFHDSTWDPIITKRVREL